MRRGMNEKKYELIKYTSYWINWRYITNVAETHNTEEMQPNISLNVFEIDSNHMFERNCADLPHWYWTCSLAAISEGSLKSKYLHLPFLPWICLGPRELYSDLLLHTPDRHSTDHSTWIRSLRNTEVTTEQRWEDCLIGWFWSHGSNSMKRFLQRCSCNIPRASFWTLIFLP